jgi:hypothetical protein
MRHTKRFGLAAGGAGILFLIGTVGALACTSLATITPSTPSGEAGTAVTITGQAFDPAGSAVSLHWNALQGPVLAQAQPDAAGSINASVAIPADAQAGYYVIIATQNDKTGAPAFGTPARASFQVGTPSAATSTGANGAPASNVAPPAASTAASSNQGLNGGWLAAVAILGILGVGLFAAGVGFFIGEVRRGEAVALARR